MSFNRLDKNNDNLLNSEFSEPSTNIGELLASFPQEELAQMVGVWEQRLNNDTVALAAINAPVAKPQKTKKTQPKPKKPIKERQERENERKSINKPGPLYHVNGDKVKNDDLVALDLFIPLTEADKKTLQPGPNRHQVFLRAEGKFVEAIRYAMFKSDYLWVQAMPVNGCVVYVDPKEYPNVKNTESRMLDGVHRIRLSSYGDPPIFVTRYGAYRKIYDINNNLKKSTHEEQQNNGLTDAATQEVPQQNINQPAISNTTNPLYQIEPASTFFYPYNVQPSQFDANPVSFSQTMPPQPSSIPTLYLTPLNFNFDFTVPTELLYESWQQNNSNNVGVINQPSVNKSQQVIVIDDEKVPSLGKKDDEDHDTCTDEFVISNAEVPPIRKSTNLPTNLFSHSNNVTNRDNIERELTPGEVVRFSNGQQKRPRL